MGPGKTGSEPAGIAAASPGEGAGRMRLPAIDVARGIAIVAMAIYHFTWDLGYFGFTTLQAGVDPAWRLFAKGIASSFLILVGVSLVLATQGGLKRGPYLRRLMMVGLAAAAITGATLYATPQSFIFFGILHCIALSSIIALPLLGAPVWWLLLIAALCAAAPSFLASPVFESPAWLWLGLAPRPPLTNDYVPMLPWFAAVLVGIALARTGLAWGWDRRLAGWKPGRFTSVLALGGRHSLLVYLVHQPLFFGLMTLAAAVGVPKAAPQAALPQEILAEFVEACTSTCVGTGTDAGICQTNCGCLAARLPSAAALAERAMRNALTQADEDSIRTTALACRSPQQPPRTEPSPSP